jgi:predicted DCC family thiol-disulfide oxidoreductase YuxK
MNKYDHEIQLTLFYDGLCPVCSREIAWLRRKNKHGWLEFQDINNADFDPAVYGKTLAELMAELHGVYPDGRIIKGMDVFRAAYSEVGLGWWLLPTGWPLLKPLFDRLYRLFSKYRLNLARLVADEPCDCGATHLKRDG